MPADHLTDVAPLAAAVRQVLNGTPAHTVAAGTGMDLADLHDALDTYHTAGLTALHQQPDDAWYHVRVEFSDWQNAEQTAAHYLGPQLDQLRNSGAIENWWFLRKHPCWRLRIRTTEPSSVNRRLDDLAARGAITGWRPGHYEPETTSFGGPTGMRIAHDLFCADSHGLLNYLRQPHPGLGRRELSLLLLSGLLHATCLDWFECGDVFGIILQHRPSDTDDDRIARLADSVRSLLAVPPDPDSPLFQPGGNTGFTGTWLAAHITAGQQLREAAATDTIHRGPRAILAHIVIFHWNRLGLPARTQGILARAAVEAFLPGANP